MLLILFLTFLTFIISSTISFIYLSVVCFAQALVVAADALVTVLALPFHVIDWIRTLWSALISGLILGLAVVVREGLDYVKATFLAFCYCLLVALHGARRLSDSGRSWSGVSGQTRTEAARRDDGGRDKYMPSFATDSVTVGIPERQRHHPYNQSTDTTESNLTSPYRPVLTAIRSKLVKVILRSGYQQTPSLTRLVRSSATSNSPLPSPPRSPQSRSRSRYIARRIRARRQSGLCDSSSVDSLSCLLYGGSTVSTVMPKDVAVTAKVFAGVMVDSVGMSRAYKTSKHASTDANVGGIESRGPGIRQEEIYKNVMNKLKIFQMILDHDE